MSLELRSTSLAHAIAFHKGEAGLAGVLATAKQFEAYISGTSEPKPVEKAEPVKAAKAEKAKPVKVEEPAAEPEIEGPTQATVAAVIDELLQANLRAQTVALLGKFKAKNASAVKAEDRAAFIEAAGALLLAG